MTALPSGTVTFLFTDIEGSTDLLQRLGDHRYAEVLAEHQRLLRDVFAKGNGQEIDTQGDAFLVAFSRARDAVATAVAAQQALMKHPWPDAATLRVRMGLHTGEPVSEKGRYVGLDVHRAARICAAAHGGQILVSQTTRDLIVADLPKDARLTDLGDHRLKDLSAPQRIHQLVATGLQEHFPPVRSLDRHPHNLPVQLTSFIGRDRELAEVRKLLSVGRLVTLTGIGGSGKTRLAEQLAADLLDAYPDGVWFIELAAASDPQLVPKVVASVLGITDQSNRPMMVSLIESLRTKTALLVLDNCEHVLSAAGDVADEVLRACPSLRVLATSREPLDIPGEAVRRVSSMSLPGPDHSLEDLGKVEAIRLFVDRAILTQPAFAVSEENASAVRQVVTRLDGIPLAIELAAARMRVLTIDQLASRLDDRFSLLTGGGRRTLPRHQTLRATMDWSYDLLSEAERELLRRLSVFAGGWTLEAAEFVTLGGKVQPSSVLDLLTQLVDKSLVVAEALGGEARYRLLETVRQYALDRLIEAGEALDVRDRHRDWYLALAERAWPDLFTERQDRWLDILEMEHDNFRASLGWCETGPTGAEPALRITGALFYFWNIRGHWSEGRRRLELALANGAGAPPPTRLQPLVGAALFASRQGDYERAVVLADQGLEICREIKDDASVPDLLYQRAIARSRLEQYGAAEHDLLEMLRLVEERKDAFRVGWALSQLAAVEEIGRGNIERGEALRREALRLARVVGAKWFIAFALYGLGFFLLRKGDVSGAQQLYEESLCLSGRLGDKWVSNQCLDGFAGIAVARQDHRRGARLLGASEALRQRLGITRTPHGQMVFESLTASLRSALGDDAFQAAWGEGQAMTLEQAIEYALRETE